MFKFLKEKLGKALSKFKKEVEEDAEIVEATKEETPKASETYRNQEISEGLETRDVSRKVSKTQVSKKKAEEKKIEKKEEVEKKEKKIEEKDVEKEKTFPEKAPITAPSAEEKKGFFAHLFKKKEEIKEEPVEEKVNEDKKIKTEKVPVAAPSAGKEDVEEKKGFFKKLGETFTTVHISDEKFNSIFWDLEVVLMENNVAVEVIEKIKEDMRKELTSDKVKRGKVEDIIQNTLKHSVQELFEMEKIDLVKKIKSKKPYVICFIGVNGSAKTTTMAKLAHLLMKNKFSVVFAAADTFRAAAIQQLEEHAKKLGVKVIKHDYGSDPAAVAFDAIQHAKAKDIDVVLIDTAGRLHANQNLMNELKKLIKVNKPDMKIFVGESITGNDCVEQAKTYNEEVGIDAIILAKADVDEKGGAAISVSYVTGKPILYLGTGQTYDDLKAFEPEVVVQGLGLE